MTNQTIRTAITPLRFIFWGGLLCVFDFNISETTNGEGWKFDILNDLVGMVMITWGTFQLAKLEVDDRYRTAMLFVQVVAVLSCFEAFHGHFIYRTPQLMSFLTSVLGVAAMSATVVFCVAMSWLCREYNVPESARSWNTTTILFVVIYLIPLGLFYAAAAIAIATESSFSINLGPAGLLLLPVFCIPIIHLFVSTSRMLSEIESSSFPDEPDAEWEE